MLRVTIELVPHGDEKKSRVLETFKIVNTGIQADYETIYDCVWGDVKAHVLHDRNNHVFELVSLAIDALKKEGKLKA